MLVDDALQAALLTLSKEAEPIRERLRMSEWDDLRAFDEMREPSLTIKEGYGSEVIAIEFA